MGASRTSAARWGLCCATALLLGCSAQLLFAQSGAVTTADYHQAAPLYSPHGLMVHPGQQAVMMQQPMPGTFPGQMAAHVAPAYNLPPVQPAAYGHGGGEIIGDEGGYCDDCGCDCDGGCGGDGCGEFFGLFPAGCDGYGNLAKPRIFDVAAEFVYLKRDDVARFVPFTSAGAGGPIVMSTNNLDYDHEPGARVTGSWLFTAGLDFEMSYLGGFSHSSTAQAVGPGNLFSVLSNFGTDAGAPFPGADNATFQGLAAGSTLHSVEMSVRRRYASPRNTFQGSLMTGARYVRLEETLLYTSVAPTGLLLSRTNTHNDLYGWQLGADGWMAVLPCLMVGADVKAGIYSNDASNRNSLAAPGLTLQEDARSSEVAFVGETSAIVVYQASRHLTFRGGYSFLFLESVALAPENFNTANPFGGPRTPIINTTGDTFYHGAFAGFEWLW